MPGVERSGIWIIDECSMIDAKGPGEGDFGFSWCLIFEIAQKNFNTGILTRLFLHKIISVQRYPCYTRKHVEKGSFTTLSDADAASGRRVVHSAAKRSEQTAYLSLLTAVFKASVFAVA